MGISVEVMRNEFGDNGVKCGDNGGKCGSNERVSVEIVV